MASKLFSSSFMKTWVKPEVLPIVVIIGGALGGATWYVSRLARGVDVVWDRKNNPRPWEHVDQNTNLKLFAHTDRFEKSYTRDRL
ncbi:hypothetical protein DSO57_1016981 [Entomophthora muscae]|uniref:Uncharacterized protein n=2 Tax=Entomophthora muscae TaxID=34485 RepID=A0ACC2T604_9FUNG|nr:hypothetical protein DSO57_1011917 [Entomophthora muscae]KAJ9089041.1 hypothetical protein DSO57_1016981 [Entomophthora muscae]